MLGLPLLTGWVNTPACARTQTLTGKVAKAPTGEEIREVVVKGIVNTLQSKHNAYWQKVENGMEIYWSFDNAPVHKAAFAEEHRAWFEANMPGTLLWPPAYSPDLHQVIEHAHANTMVAFNKWMLQQKVPYASLLAYRPRSRSAS